MKKYEAPQIEVTVFEVEDIVTSVFSSINLGEWDSNIKFNVEDF
jgi:hypothetical protein